MTNTKCTACNAESDNEMNLAQDKFNGWTNYATWRVNLEMWDGYEIEHHNFDDVESLEEFIKNQSEDYITNQSKGLAQDYALAFLSDVNWYEIAEHLFNESEE